MELALVAPVLFAILFGIVEFGVAAYIWSSVTEGARLGARFAIVRGSERGIPTTSADIQSAVRARMAFDSLYVYTTWPDGDNNPGHRVRVTVQRTYQPIGFFIPAITITSTSQMVIVY